MYKEYLFPARLDIYLTLSICVMANCRSSFRLCSLLTRLSLTHIIPELKAAHVHDTAACLVSLRQWPRFYGRSIWFKLWSGRNASTTPTQDRLPAALLSAMW